MVLFSAECSKSEERARVGHRVQVYTTSGLASEYLEANIFCAGTCSYQTQDGNVNFVQLSFDWYRFKLFFFFLLFSLFCNFWKQLMGTGKYFPPKTKYIVEWKDFNFLGQGMHFSPIIYTSKWWKLYKAYSLLFCQMLPFLCRLGWQIFIPACGGSH